MDHHGHGILAKRTGKEGETHFLPFPFGLDESLALCCVQFPSDAVREFFFYSTTSYRYRYELFSFDQTSPMPAINQGKLW